MTKWVDIKTFLQETGTTIREIYYRLNKREWHDGFVIKKTPKGRIRWGCVQDFEKWGGISK